MKISKYEHSAKKRNSKNETRFKQKSSKETFSKIMRSPDTSQSGKRRYLLTPKDDMPKKRRRSNRSSHKEKRNASCFDQRNRFCDNAKRSRTDEKKSYLEVRSNKSFEKKSDLELGSYERRKSDKKVLSRWD